MCVHVYLGGNSIGMFQGKRVMFYVAPRDLFLGLMNA